MGLGREDLDFSNLPLLRDRIIQLRPKYLINCAAYTAVDKAESPSEQAECLLINSQLPGVLAEIAKELHIPFVHYSTDYVYTGIGTHFQNELEPVSPQNFYGKSKLAGENNVVAAGGQYLIFRTSWVYSEWGNNFVKTMLRLGAERETLKVVSDQIGAPTYAMDIATSTLRCLETADCLSETHFPTGIYHLCGQGTTSWFEFAQEIFNIGSQLDFPMKIKNLIPIPTSDYPTPAKRPLNSRLNQEKLNKVFGVSLPDWKDSLNRCMQALQKETKYESN